MCGGPAPAEEPDGFLAPKPGTVDVESVEQSGGRGCLDQGGLKTEKASDLLWVLPLLTYGCSPNTVPYALARGF